MRGFGGLWEDLVDVGGVVALTTVISILLTFATYATGGASSKGTGDKTVPSTKDTMGSILSNTRGIISSVAKDGGGNDGAGSSGGGARRGGPSGAMRGRAGAGGWGG